MKIISTNAELCEVFSRKKYELEAFKNILLKKDSLINMDGLWKSRLIKVHTSGYNESNQIELNSLVLSFLTF